MFTGLRARLLLLLGLAVLPSVAFLIVGRNNERRASERELHGQALNLAKLTAQSWAQRIEIARQVLLSMARHPAMHGDAAECSALVRGLKGDYEDIYATLGRADLSGAVDCLQLDGGQPGLIISDRDYFLRARESGQFVVGEFMHGRIRRLPTLAFSYPLRDARGAIHHIMFVNVDLTVLSRELEASTRMAGTTVSLLDRNGVLIARSAEADRFFGVKTPDDQLQTMRDRGEMVSTFAGADGIRRIFAIVPVRDRTNAIVAFATAGIPETNLSGMMAAGIRSDWIMLGMLAGGLLLVAWGGSELLIRRPVAKLLTATAKLAEGDFAARIAPVGGARELEVLAAAFNRMARDLEERELHLREGQRLEAVGQLAGGIAHDFNNLLTVIIGYADVLQDRFQPAAKEAKQIGALRSAADRASKLTQQLLAFSRRQVLSPATLQLNEVIGDMASLLRRTSGGDVTITLALDETLGYVHADPVQIEQVILNLAINARDAMPGGGRVTIATRNVTEGVSPLVELSISDTGVGMDATTRARIFEPFFTTKGPRGTGLGLATAYGIVKQSGGDIVCESEVGVGTRFDVRLPRTPAPPATPEVLRPPQVRGGSETVLLVDDDDAVREVLQEVMVQRGYRVRATADANEALTWLANGFTPDMILTDVRMPGMNGASFARAIRAGDVVPPIVFISGDSAGVLADEDPNGSRFLQKPIAAAALLREIRDVLDSRPAVSP